MSAPIRYWLFKSEPSSFSIDDLAASPKQTTCWDGVRNYQARNLLRDEVKIGDRVLFYHSSADPPGVAGTATVVREAYPDDTAWDKNGGHYDPKASPENPIWQMVDIRLESRFDELIPLPRLREESALEDMMLLKRGSRLSVQPVTATEFDAILRLAGITGRSASKKRAKRASVAPKSASKRASKPTKKKAKRGSTRGGSRT